ncbi:hypothetical protein HQ585_17295 [candidate division KSB1 bacterium]|nr:hypothetical protein [candidate division KSB1 bacterium]
MSELQEVSFVHEPEKPKSLEVLNIPEVRVSSASFVRIKDPEGRQALLVNKNRAKKGVIVLTPIGGAIEANSTGIEDLKRLLGIDESAFEKGNDLRFKMNGEKANEYRSWFLGGEHRESEPSREVYEELVDESGLLNSEELEGLQCSRAGYATELAQTTRIGQEGQVTLRLLEVFDAELKPDTLKKLVELSQGQNALVRFVTDEEIRNGKTEDRTEIGTVTQSLLNIQDTIAEFV